jgi:uracil-DNA glycosylase
LWDGGEHQLLPMSHWHCDASWRELIEVFWAEGDGLKLLEHLRQAQETGSVIYPPQPLRALSLTPLSSVRVVIMGQDPYHQPGQANGLAFSVGPGQKRPPSLRNLLTEVERSCGETCIHDGQLEPWARQGVLLLNTVLTVSHDQPASHKGWGWETLTLRLMAKVIELPKPVAFVLWGGHAQALRGHIDESRHRVWVANHPSPLSARRGPIPFVGCDHFAQINAWLCDQGQAPVVW